MMSFLLPLWFHRFLLRFRWRHEQLGCVRYLGISICGEPMYLCRLHDRVW